VKFGQKQIVDTVTGGSVYDFVAWLLVGPGGAEAGSVDHFKDGVGSEQIVRIDGNAAARGVERELVRIQSATVDGVRINVDALIQSDFRSFDRALRTRRRQHTVITGLVVDPSGKWRATGDDGQDAGKRIRRPRRGCLDIVPARLFQLGQRGGRV
jgi:hypothetical protein